MIRDAIPSVTNSQGNSSSNIPQQLGPVTVATPYVKPVVFENELLSKKEMKSLTKQIFNSSLKRTFDLVKKLYFLKISKSDEFYRRQRGLPPHPDEVLMCTEFSFHESDEEEDYAFQVFQYAEDLKSWLFHASKEGAVFEFAQESAAKIPEIVEILDMLQSWAPPQRQTNWEMIDEVSVIVTVLAGFAQQKYYTERILNPSDALHTYITVLLQYAENGDNPGDSNPPSDHLWHRLMMLMFSSLLVGIQLMNSVYHSPADLTLLGELKPIAVKYLYQFTSSYAAANALEKFQVQSNSTTPDEMCDDFKNWLADFGFMTELKGLLWAFQLFPLELITIVSTAATPLALSSPLLTYARHYHREVLRFASLCPQYAQLHAVHMRDCLHRYQTLIHICGGRP
eukprot:gene36668-47798_t